VGIRVKIAVVTHYFWPEMSAPSARLLEMGRAWATEGHEVSVVTNFPNHPTGVVPEAYRGRPFLIETHEGLRIVRCRTYATPNRGMAKRTLGHLVFMTQAVLQGTPAIRGSDVIVASSPTLFSVVAAWIMSWRLGVPFVFEVRDLWPAIFVDLGVFRNRLLIRGLESLEMFLYRRSRAVVTVTEGFARHIADIPCAPPASSTRDRARTCSRLAGSCSAQRRGGWRAWGAVRADFERALADPADPAVASAEIASDFRRGAGYVRVTLPRPRVLPGLKGPRVRVTLPRPGGR